MTIDRAIEILVHLLNPKYFLISTNEQDSIRLGIQALETIKEFREVYHKKINTPMAGETKEKE